MQNHDDLERRQIDEFIGEGGPALPHDEHEQPYAELPTRNWVMTAVAALGGVLLVASLAWLFWRARRTPQQRWLENAARRSDRLINSASKQAEQLKGAAANQAEQVMAAATQQAEQVMAAAANRSAQFAAEPAAAVERFAKQAKRANVERVTTFGRQLEQLGWTVRTRGPRAVAKLTDPIERTAATVRRAGRPERRFWQRWTA